MNDEVLVGEQKGVPICCGIRSHAGTDRSPRPGMVFDVVLATARCRQMLDNLARDYVDAARRSETFCVRILSLVTFLQRVLEAEAL